MIVSYVVGSSGDCIDFNNDRSSRNGIPRA